MEMASLVDDTALRRTMLTFVVAGGGFRRRREPSAR